MIIVTAADHAYYPRLLALIGSLQHSNYRLLQRVIVYDLGMRPGELQRLSRLSRVELRPMWPVNPQVLTPLQSHPGHDRMVPGLYSWKPAIIERVLREQGALLWLDAGTTVYGPLDQLWQHLLRTGHWLTAMGTIGWMTPQPIRQRLRMTPAQLAAPGICAGHQGCTTAVLDSYVAPTAAHCGDLSWFQDDGTALGGPTAGRHDQTLFSYHAAVAGLEPLPLGEARLYDGSRFRMIADPGELTADTHIYQSRGDARLERFMQYLR